MSLVGPAGTLVCDKCGKMKETENEFWVYCDVSAIFCEKAADEYLKSDEADDHFYIDFCSKKCYNEFFGRAE